MNDPVTNRMMKRTAATFTLFITFGSAALCQEAGDTINRVDAKGLKQGYWLSKFENGRTDYEGYFKDGRPVRLMNRYYDNGDIKSNFVYYDHDRACAAHIFYRDSVLMAQGLYRGETKDSTWIFYDTKGRIVSDENYRIGVKNGISRVYYPNGQLYEMFTWKNGVKNGPWKQYFESGLPKAEGRYIGEKLEGWTRFYNKDGSVSSEGLYRTNVKDSVWSHYDEEGKIAIQQKYDMGQLKNKKEVSEYIRKNQEAEKKE